MAPNLLVATQTLFTPHKWFARKSSEKSVRRSEHWDDPQPGIYEYIPGRGWYLTRRDGPDGTPDERLEKPRLVKYSRVVRRYLFDTEYQRRKLTGELTDAHGKVREVGFFLLDDGVAWVNCWNHKGEFIPGPYERWVVDERTEKFRKMLKGDDPAWRSRQSSRTRGRGMVSTSRRTSAESDKDDKNKVYNIPSLGYSRPASTIDLVISPQSSRPPSPTNRSEGATRSNSRANSFTGSTKFAPLRPSNLRENSTDEASSPPSMSASTTTASSTSTANGATTPRSLAAAVTSRLEEHQLAEQKVL